MSFRKESEELFKRVTVTSASGMVLSKRDELIFIGEVGSINRSANTRFESLTKELEELIESSPELKDKFLDWLETWSGYYEVEFEVDMDP